MKVSYQSLLVFTYKGLGIYAEIAFALPTRMRPEVAVGRAELLWTQ